MSRLAPLLAIALLSATPICARTTTTDRSTSLAPDSRFGYRLGVGYRQVPIVVETRRPDGPAITGARNAGGFSLELGTELWPVHLPFAGVGGFAEGHAATTIVRGGREGSAGYRYGGRAFLGWERAATVTGELGWGRRLAGTLDGVGLDSTARLALDGGQSDTATGSWAVGVRLCAVRSQRGHCAFALAGSRMREHVALGSSQVWRARVEIHDVVGLAAEYAPDYPFANAGGGLDPRAARMAAVLCVRSDALSGPWW